MSVPFEFDPTKMVRRLEQSGDYTREELIGFWGIYVSGMQFEQLQETQSEIQDQRSWLGSMEQVLVEERSRRIPPDIS
jgi:hypothetical protein